MPKTTKPVPGIVLISGSGPNTRDENIFGHEIFAVIADYLTRRGYAVLRYDKRGVGKSTGDYSNATTSDFAVDADAAVKFLKSYPGIDHSKIGVIGHSEGGMIAPLVADRDQEVKFVVLLAGPAVKGIDVLLRQQVLLAQGEGTPEKEIDQYEQFQKYALNKAISAGDTPESRADVTGEYLKVYAGSASPEVLSAQASAMIGTLFSPWFRSFLAFDPAPNLKALDVPVLALSGSKDRQVDPEQNLPVMRKLLAQSKSKNWKVVEIPGLNHVFQDCKTGAFSEYAQIEETFSPAALKIIGDWLAETVKK